MLISVGGPDLGPVSGFSATPDAGGLLKLNRDVFHSALDIAVVHPTVTVVCSVGKVEGGQRPCRTERWAGKVLLRLELSVYTR